MKGISYNPSSVLVQPENSRPEMELSEAAEQNISVRFIDFESQFRGNNTECWDKYVDKYSQIARIYKLFDAKRL